jgi:hypothetical protein
VARTIWGVFSRAGKSPGGTGRRALIGASSLGLILAATSVGWAPGAFAAQAGAPHGGAARATSGIQARTQSAPSCNDNWLGGSGVWTDGSNWSAGQPTVNSNVCITAPGTYTVTIDSLFYVNWYTIGGTSGTQTLALDSNNDDEADLVVHGVTNSEINPKGAVVLNSNLVNGKSYAAGLGIDVVGPTLTNDGSFSTSGSGQTSIGLGFTNDSDGTVILGAAVTQDSPDPMVNRGSFTVSNGADYAANDVFTQDSGTLDVAGTMTESAGGAVFNEDGGAETHNAVMLDGFVTFNDKAGTGSFILEGVNDITGTVPVRQTVMSLSTKGIETDTEFHSPGLTNHGTLILESTGTAPFPCSIGSGGTTLTNYGTLDFASRPAGLDDLVATLVNKVGGTTEVMSGANFNANATNHGTLRLATRAALLNNGYRVTNDGILLLGQGARFQNSPGTLVDGSSSITEVTIVAPGASGSGGSSKITGGSVSVAGTLRVTTVGKPKVGATTRPIASTALKGTFAHLKFVTAVYKVIYSSSAATLRVV